MSDTIDILEEYHKYVPLKPDGQPFKLVLHADGLSVERGNNAQNARINGNTAWLQLQGLQMNIQEWHKRCLLLQVRVYEPPPHFIENIGTCIYGYIHICSHFFRTYLMRCTKDPVEGGRNTLSTYLIST